MNLRRPVGSRVFMVGFAALSAGFVGYLVNLQFTVSGSVSGRLCIGVISLIGLFMVANFLWYGLGRFQVDVDRDGWTVWIGRYRRDLRWAEISAVVIQNREAEGQGHRRAVPALFLVPDPDSSLDVPKSLRATVDGRPAMRLSDLDDLRIDDEEQFVRDLAGLAGDRFEVRVHRLSQMLLSEDARRRLNGERALPAFPPGVLGVRTQRWLNRRRFLLYVGWYLFVVVPALVLTVFAAGLHELLGVAVAIMALFAIFAAYTQFVTLFSHADLVEDEMAIAGTELVRVIGDRTYRYDMHGGKAVVLPPGAKRGYGKAWLLGFPYAVMLLGDPRTGRLRDHADLHALSAVLRASPHEADRAAARDIDSLTLRSQVDDPMEQPGGVENARLWMSLTKAGRTFSTSPCGPPDRKVGRGA